MRLTRVEIKNFRSIKNEKIVFDPTCRVLVGINESGKSNILAALSLLDSSVTIVPSDIREPGKDESPVTEAIVRFVFALDESDRAKIVSRMQGEIISQEEDPILVSQKEKALTLKQFVAGRSEVLYTANLRTGKRYFAVWVLPESFTTNSHWLKANANIPEGFVVPIGGDDKFSVAKGDLVAAGLVAPDFSEYFSVADADYLNTLFSRKVAAAMEDQLPSCLYWTYHDSYLLPAQIAITTFQEDPASCKPLLHMFSLADVTDIKAAITSARLQPHGLRNLLRRVAAAATKHIRSVWKEYKSIEIELSHNGDFIDASVKDHFNSFEFARRSDGFKRFISFLIMVSALVRKGSLVNTLYLHDEPDIGLHPSGARFLRDELISISKNNYVVYSTHSIFMIDRDQIGRHLLVRKKDEITAVEEAHDSNIADEEVIYNALGYSIFEILREKNIIFEGWRDKKLFRVALTSATQKYKDLKKTFDDVGLCHAKGVKGISSISPFLELANRKWIVISDSDKVAREQQNQYKGEGTWLRYDQLLPEENGIVTGEDFIKVDAFRRPLELISSENPELPPFDIATIASTNRLAIIRKWLAEGGFNKEKQDTTLNSLKSAIFDHLEYTQIEDFYFSAVENIAANLP